MFVFRLLFLVFVIFSCTSLEDNQSKVGANGKRKTGDRNPANNGAINGPQYTIGDGWFIVSNYFSLGENNEVVQSNEPPEGEKRYIRVNTCYLGSVPKSGCNALDFKDVIEGVYQASDDNSYKSKGSIGSIKGALLEEDTSFSELRKLRHSLRMKGLNDPEKHYRCNGTGVTARTVSLEGRDHVFISDKIPNKKSTKSNYVELNTCYTLASKSIQELKRVNNLNRKIPPNVKIEDFEKEMRKDQGLYLVRAKQLKFVHDDSPVLLLNLVTSQIPFKDDLSPNTILNRIGLQNLGGFDGSAKPGAIFRVKDNRSISLFRKLEFLVSEDVADQVADAVAKELDDDASKAEVKSFIKDEVNLEEEEPVVVRGYCKSNIDQEFNNFYSPILEHVQKYPANTLDSKNAGDVDSRDIFVQTLYESSKTAINILNGGLATLRLKYKDDPNCLSYLEKRVELFKSDLVTINTVGLFIKSDQLTKSCNEIENGPEGIALSDVIYGSLAKVNQDFSRQPIINLTNTEFTSESGSLIGPVSSRFENTYVDQGGGEFNASICQDSESLAKCLFRMNRHWVTQYFWENYYSSGGQDKLFRKTKDFAKNNSLSSSQSTQKDYSRAYPQSEQTLDTLNHAPKIYFANIDAEHRQCKTEQSKKICGGFAYDDLNTKQIFQKYYENTSMVSSGKKDPGGKDAPFEFKKYLYSKHGALMNYYKDFFEKELGFSVASLLFQSRYHKSILNQEIIAASIDDETRGRILDFVNMNKDLNNFRTLKKSLTKTMLDVKTSQVGDPNDVTSENYRGKKNIKPGSDQWNQLAFEQYHFKAVELATDKRLAKFSRRFVSDVKENIGEAVWSDAINSVEDFEKEVTSPKEYYQMFKAEALELDSLTGRIITKNFEKFILFAYKNYYSGQCRDNPKSLKAGKKLLDLFFDYEYEASPGINSKVSQANLKFRDTFSLPSSDDEFGEYVVDEESCIVTKDKVKQLFDGVYLSQAGNPLFAEPEYGNEDKTKILNPSELISSYAASFMQSPFAGPLIFLSDTSDFDAEKLQWYKILIGYDKYPDIKKRAELLADYSKTVMKKGMDVTWIARDMGSAKGALAVSMYPRLIEEMLRSNVKIPSFIGSTIGIFNSKLVKDGRMTRLIDESVVRFFKHLLGSLNTSVKGHYLSAVASVLPEYSGMFNITSVKDSWYFDSSQPLISSFEYYRRKAFSPYKKYAPFIQQRITSTPGTPNPANDDKIYDWERIEEDLIAKPGKLLGFKGRKQRGTLFKILADNSAHSLNFCSVYAPASKKVKLDEQVYKAMKWVDMGTNLIAGGTAVRSMIKVASKLAVRRSLVGKASAVFGIGGTMTTIIHNNELYLRAAMEGSNTEQQLTNLFSVLIEKFKDSELKEAFESLFQSYMSLNQLEKDVRFNYYMDLISAVLILGDVSDIFQLMKFLAQSDDYKKVINFMADNKDTLGSLEKKMVKSFDKVVKSLKNNNVNDDQVQSIRMMLKNQGIDNPNRMQLADLIVEYIEKVGKILDDPKTKLQHKIDLVKVLETPESMLSIFDARYVDSLLNPAKFDKGKPLYRLARSMNGTDEFVSLNVLTEKTIQNSVESSKKFEVLVDKLIDQETLSSSVKGNTKKLQKFRSVLNEDIQKHLDYDQELAFYDDVLATLEGSAVFDPKTKEVVDKLTASLVASDKKSPLGKARDNLISWWKKQWNNARNKDFTGEVPNCGTRRGGLRSIFKKIRM